MHELVATAAFSEELFFRGLLQSAIENVSNLPIALTASSLIFGFLHFPFWGANVLAEIVLGQALGFAYWYSDYNLAVPIAIHTMYDFVGTFLIWNSARNDLKRLVGDFEQLSKFSEYETDKLALAVSNFTTLSI